MAASGMFGFGVSVKKFELLECFDLVYMYNESEKNDFIENLNKIKGFSEKTSSKVYEGMKGFLEFLHEVKGYFVIGKDENQRRNS